MTLGDVMCREVWTCRRESNLAAAAATMWENDCGVLPVVDEHGRVVGVLSDRDICIALGTRNRPASEIAAAEIMCDDVTAARAADDLRAALAAMVDAKVRRLPVLDDGGLLVGIVSLDDLANVAGDGPDAALTFAEVGMALKALFPHRSRAATASAQ